MERKFNDVSFLFLESPKESDTTFCFKACQILVAGWWFSPGTQVSSTNKTDRHDITEILLKGLVFQIAHREK
jgi:hypothetical protein